MIVTIDGASFKGSLPYPSIKALSARSHIGGQHDPTASGGVLRGTGLRGRVGAVYLLDEHVKEEQMRALHARGPDYAAACRPSSSVLLDPALEGSLLSHNRVMLLLHPSRLHNGPCLSPSSSTDGFQMEVEETGWVSAPFFDGAWEWRGRPLLEMVRERGQQDGWVREQQQQPALLGRGVVAVARSSVIDALDCVGGAKVGGMWRLSKGTRGEGGCVYIHSTHIS